jgi:hypothetical protein
VGACLAGVLCRPDDADARIVDLLDRTIDRAHRHLRHGGLEWNDFTGPSTGLSILFIRAVLTPKARR